MAHGNLVPAPGFQMRPLWPGKTGVGAFLLLKEGRVFHSGSATECRKVAKSN